TLKVFNIGITTNTVYGASWYIEPSNPPKQVLNANGATLHRGTASPAFTKNIPATASGYDILAPLLIAQPYDEWAEYSTFAAYCGATRVRRDNHNTRSRVVIGDGSFSVPWSGVSAEAPLMGPLTYELHADDLGDNG